MISSTIKLADIVDIDYHILPVFWRFGINLGFGDKTIKQICFEKNINEIFFTEIINVYLVENYLPSENFDKITIFDLLFYLRNSHNYFVDIQLKHLKTNIERLYLQSKQDKNFHIIRKFYDNYQQEMLEHIYFEEKTVFPYIENLVNGITMDNSKFRIEQYSQNHTNIEEKLSDLKHLLTKYISISAPQHDIYSLVSDIYDFEKDLNKHQIFEEKILIPKVLNLENSLK